MTVMLALDHRDKLVSRHDAPPLGKRRRSKRSSFCTKNSFSSFCANRSFFVVVSPCFCQHGGSSWALQAALGGVADAPPVWWKISSCYSPEAWIHAEEKILLYWTLNGISPADDSDIRSSGGRHTTEISKPVLRKGLCVGLVFTRTFSYFG